MKIGLDVMGGDFAPKEAIKGVVELLSAPDLVDVQLTLIGNQKLIKEHLHGHEIPAHFRIINTDVNIGMAENQPRPYLKKEAQASTSGLKCSQKVNWMHLPEPAILVL